MVVDRAQRRWHEQSFAEIATRFGANDLLVFNRSKVIPARLRLPGKREIFLSEQVSGLTWKCLVRPGKKFLAGTVAEFADGSTARVVDTTEDGLRLIEFAPAQDDFWAFVDCCGEMPLPPYIARETDAADAERYQTVYADRPGSVAAPTAGLHFSDELLDQLRQRGVQTEFVTLHVGLGTFLPVKTDNIAEHHMHAEVYEIESETAERINAAKASGKQLTAVGSTSLRTLESASEGDGCIKSGSGKTEIFLYPPAEFWIIDHFLTNFHLPKSTLMMLVAAFASPGKTDGIELAKAVYAEAIAKKFRFFSYGDATLWW